MLSVMPIAGDPAATVTSQPSMCASIQSDLTSAAFPEFFDKIPAVSQPTSAPSSSPFSSKPPSWRRFNSTRHPMTPTDSKPRGGQWRRSAICMVLRWAESETWIGPKRRCRRGNNDKAKLDARTAAAMPMARTWKGFNDEHYYTPSLVGDGPIGKDT